jgi:hypothetical protein
LEKAGRVIVIWGGNRFIDCVDLLAWKDRSVLRLSAAPVRIDLRVSPAVSEVSGSQLEVSENRIVGSVPRQATVNSLPNAFALLWTELPIVIAQEIGMDTVSQHPMILLHTDLRPLGMNVFDDAAGIHVGGDLIARTAFSRCSRAITLG